MPSYKQNLVFELARNLKAFVNFEAKLTRVGGATPQASSSPSAAGSTSERPEGYQRELHRLQAELEKKDGDLDRLRETIKKKNTNLQRWREWVANKDEVIGRLRGQVAGGRASSSQPENQKTPGMKPESIIWIFGTGRGGSTWLRSMMSEMKSHRVWEEPMVGLLFGDFYNKAQRGQLQSKSFVLGDPAREGWIESIRVFLLNRASHLYPDFGKDSLLVVKEPNGSAGAPLIMEALPESRMIFLVRDPRDVAASVIDATKSGSWMYNRKSKGDWKQGNISDNKPDVMAKRRANKYVEHVGAAKKAYDRHRGPKVLVRYEDLVADTTGTMSRIYSELGIPVNAEELSQAVEKHSWANIPEDKKGEGKFYRKGVSGSWREDLTGKQVEIVESITAPLLEEFYPEQGVGSSRA